ncbi:hypothetical protein GCM10010423_29140 [Streptomyces levis]|uniref:Uncharacterized protein n=1 Tax=Streptomyces levis TaxID=285566 RepID=A0ABN3NR15_9ACTN
MPRAGGKGTGQPKTLTKRTRLQHIGPAALSGPPAAPGSQAAWTPATGPTAQRGGNWPPPEARHSLRAQHSPLLPGWVGRGAAPAAACHAAGAPGVRCAPALAARPLRALRAPRVLRGPRPSCRPRCAAPGTDNAVRCKAHMSAAIYARSVLEKLCPAATRRATALRAAYERHVKAQRNLKAGKGK